ncbi:MAG: hypothetical protein HC767_06915 [Akkermansiaceae bacterium]|nr:hypothetical protein [Akkermansiaceae bacterium]
MQAALELHPELAGSHFRDVHFRLPDSIAMGVLREERMHMCPPDDFILRPSDELLLLRRSGSMQRPALREPLVAGPDSWEPKITAQEFAMVCFGHLSAPSFLCVGWVAHCC